MEPYESYLETYSKQFNLPKKYLIGIVLTESSGNPYAMRYEPGWNYFVDCRNGNPFRHLTTAEKIVRKAPDDFPKLAGVSSRDTEYMGQATSWGWMQIMGSVARELGFTGAFPELCGPAGLKYGCMHLDRLRKRHFNEFGWAGVIAAYNAGTPSKTLGSNRFLNQEYVDKVLKNSS